MSFTPAVERTEKAVARSATDATSIARIVHPDMTEEKRTSDGCIIFKVNVTAFVGPRTDLRDSSVTTLEMRGVVS